MKKVVLTLFTLATLAACSSTEIIDSGSSNNNAIAFGNVCTRAGLSDIQTNGFGVWAVINNELQSNYLLMANQKVEYTDGEWGYSPTQYWVDNTVYSFVAVWPYGDSAYMLEADKTVKLTVSETPAATDYLVATNITDTGAVDGYSSTVVLDFQHVLTSVGVKIWRDGGKHQNDQMRITKVTLSNIRKNGSYSSATDLWTYGDDKLTVEMVNTNLSDTDNIGAATNNNGSLTTGGIPATPFGTMMLLPQALDSSNAVSLKIEYQLKRQNAEIWETAELETVLPTITWIAGQQYTYNVVLSSVKYITVYYIQTTVDPWGTPQVGGTVIIK